VLSGGAAARIMGSELDELVVTNTISLGAETAHCKKIRVLSAAELLAETIRRISSEDSVSSLFMD
jgi:ribose-phosphate pyrophosphokinase